MDHARLTTVAEVLHALGGVTAVASLTNRSPQAVSNWRERGGIPPGTFLVMSAELSKLGISANPSLWSMDEPETAA